jgi:hypothetical protein
MPSRSRSQAVLNAALPWPITGSVLALLFVLAVVIFVG